MSAALKLETPIQNDKTTISSNTAILVSCSETQNIEISNKLNQNFKTSARTYHELKEGLDYLMSHSCDLLVINIDHIDKESTQRIEELINFKQIPTIILSNNPNADEEFGISKNNKFVQFVITTSMKKHFINSVEHLIANTGTGAKFQHRISKVSTSTKPRSFYFLASILFLEPIFKILYMKFSTGFDFEIVFRTILSISGFVTNFEFWFMFPLAGIALVTEKSWSFLVFIGVQAYCLFAHFYYVEFTWPYVSDSPHVSSSFLMIINTAIILYFMVPEHRRPFWNKSQKLWRNTSRYTTELPTYFTSGGEKLYTSITNISKTGAYFTSNENIPVGEKTQLQFILNGKVHEVNATIKRTHTTEQKSEYGYGVEFDSLTPPVKEVITEFVEGLNTKIQ